MQYPITLCSLPEVASDVISGTVVGQIVSHKAVNHGYLSLSLYQEIQLKVVGYGVFDALFHIFFHYICHTRCGYQSKIWGI